MQVPRAALREFGGLVGGIVGVGGDDDGAALPRRGALWVALQTAATAAVVAVVITGRALLSGRANTMLQDGAGAWGAPSLLFVAFFLSLPMAMHWFAQPPRRIPGLAAGLATTAVAAAPVLLLPETAFWIDFVLVAAAFVAGGVVFGAVSTKPAPSRATSA